VPTDRVARRRIAEGIARKHEVDAGDVEHVLSNLTLPPLERLRRSMRRAQVPVRFPMGSQNFFDRSVS